MFASLLAASRASNLRLVGSRMDADMNAGRIPPSGSTSPAPRGVPSVVPGRLIGSEDTNGPPRSGSVSEDRGTTEGSPELSVCAEDGNDDDDDGCMNMDFVPSANRPPSGGEVTPASAGAVSDETSGGRGDFGTAAGGLEGPAFGD